MYQNNPWPYIRQKQENSVLQYDVHRLLHEIEKKDKEITLLKIEIANLKKMD